jgi:conjugal transfer pilus assembly protein TraV
MDRYKIIAAAGLLSMLSGCVYDSNFTCEGYKNAGRACKPVSSNIEYAISKDDKTEAAEIESQPEVVSGDEHRQELFVKCDTDEPCNYKPAETDLLIVSKDAKKYLDFKKNEQKLLAEELTSYGIKVNADNTPVTSKPKVLRVTILPYEDAKGRLNMMRRVYMILQKSDWLLGDYLIVDDKQVEVKDGQAK